MCDLVESFFPVRSAFCLSARARGWAFHVSIACLQRHGPYGFLVSVSWGFSERVSKYLAKRNLISSFWPRTDFAAVVRIMRLLRWGTQSRRHWSALTQATGNVHLPVRAYSQVPGLTLRTSQKSFELNILLFFYVLYWPHRSFPMEISGKRRQVEGVLTSSQW